MINLIQSLEIFFKVILYWQKEEMPCLWKNIYGQME